MAVTKPQGVGVLIEETGDTNIVELAGRERWLCADRLFDPLQSWSMGEEVRPDLSSGDSLQGPSALCRMPPMAGMSQCEWHALCDQVVDAMSKHVGRWVTPVSSSVPPDRAELVGTGSYLDFSGRTYLLTNEHVAQQGEEPGHQFEGCADVYRVRLPFALHRPPLDVALALVPAEVCSNAVFCGGIPSERLATRHDPQPGEMLFFIGYGASKAKFLFGQLNTPGSPYATQQAELEDDDRLDPELHFSLPYMPDRAMRADGRSGGLPSPPGLSGSLVWNTRFVECLNAGRQWSPDLAQVTGLVWGWASESGHVFATKVEHLGIQSLVDELCSS